MIIKLILPLLEIDLSNFEFTLIEENNWLNDRVTAKYTFPVEISLTPEQDVALGNITQENLTEYNSKIDCKFYVLNKEHDAVFQIESILGKSITANIQYGLEEFPNFDKKLSQLPLEKFTLQESIYTFAETIITQTWPSVNFNFPQIITDKLDTSTEQWESFLGFVNNYVDGAFIINEFDAIENVQINRNVMHPLPYLLHVLIKGFEDAGFTLQGEILEDATLKKTTLYAFNSFYFNFTGESEQITLNSSEFTTLLGNSAHFVKNIPLPEPGRYKIAGNITLRGNFFVNTNQFVEGTGFLRFNNVNIWSGVASLWQFSGYQEKFFSIDINIDYTGTEPFVFISDQLSFGLINNEPDTEAMILDLSLTQLARFDANGNLISTLVEPTVIDLQKAVPDMTFGELVTILRRQKNYGLDIGDGTVYMNKRKVKNVSTSESYNLTPYMLETPERIFNTGKTFEIKMFDFDSDEYKPEKIFIELTGFQYMDYVKKDDTETIDINAIALPLKQKDGILTAHGFLDDNSKVQFVIYDGLTAGLNLAKDPSDLTLINCYLQDLEDWFKFLITAIALRWTFTDTAESLAGLKIRSIVYAHRQFHVIRKLSMQTYVSQTKGIMLETEIETESLQ